MKLKTLFVLLLLAGGLMQLGDILMKVANNARLTPQEMEFLNRSGKETQQRNAQISGWTDASNTASFSNARFTQAEFSELPLSFFYFRSTTNQSIANSAFQTITFDENVIVSVPAYFTWNAADPTKVFVNQTMTGRGVMLYGQAQFAANATGRRAVRIVSSLADGTTIDTLVAVQAPAVTGFSTIVSFCVPFFVAKDTAYLTLEVLQTSGGALDMEAINVGIMLVK
jgi:hypothetical protein